MIHRFTPMTSRGPADRWLVGLNDSAGPLSV